MAKKSSKTSGKKTSKSGTAAPKSKAPTKANTPSSSRKPAKAAKPAKVAASPKKSTAKPASKPMAKTPAKSSSKKSVSKSPVKATGTPTAVTSKAKGAAKTAGKGASKPAVEKKLKSPLSKKEMKEFKELLLVKRAEILGDMFSMSDEALHKDSTNLSSMPMHMADLGSDNYEQELTLGLVESERRILVQIDMALQRIDEGTYGLCEESDKPIAKPRLRAKPWARYTIEVAREKERMGELG